MRGAVRGQLFNVNHVCREAGLFAKFSGGRIGEVLVRLHEATRKGPLAPEGLFATFHGQYGEAVVADREND